jgi:hypothetical protein
MRARALAIALLFAGCHSEAPVPTSLDVTVTFDDANHHPDHLVLTLVDGNNGMPMMATIYPKDQRPIRSDDNFIVLVPDALDGQMSSLALIAFELGAPTLRGQGSAKIVKGTSVPVTIHLDNGALDGGVDAALDGSVPRDGGVVDASVPKDMTTPVPDLSGVDFSGINNGPAPDVAENVALDWDVGESASMNPEACAPVKRGNVTLVADAMHTKVGNQSVRVDYTSINYFQAVYPKGENANWDLTTRNGVDVWIDGNEPMNAQGWMPNSPTIILCGAFGTYRRLDPTMNLLPKVTSGFVELKVPLAGGAGWTKTDIGMFNVNKVRSIEFHANPLRGPAVGPIQMWLDGVGFY